MGPTTHAARAAASAAATLASLRRRRQAAAAGRWDAGPQAAGAAGWSYDPDDERYFVGAGPRARPVAAAQDASSEAAQQAFWAQSVYMAFLAVMVFLHHAVLLDRQLCRAADDADGAVFSAGLLASFGGMPCGGGAAQLRFLLRRPLLTLVCGLGASWAQAAAPAVLLASAGWLVCWLAPAAQRWQFQQPSHSRMAAVCLIRLFNKALGLGALLVPRLLWQLAAAAGRGGAGPQPALPSVYLRAYLPVDGVVLLAETILYRGVGFGGVEPGDRASPGPASALTVTAVGAFDAAGHAGAPPTNTYSTLSSLPLEKLHPTVWHPSGYGRRHLACMHATRVRMGRMPLSPFLLDHVRLSSDVA